MLPDFFPWPVALLCHLLRQSWYKSQSNHFSAPIFCFLHWYIWGGTGFFLVIVLSFYFHKELCCSYQQPTNGKTMKCLYFLPGSIGFLNAQITLNLLGFWVAWSDTPKIRISALGRPVFLSSPAFRGSHCSHRAAATPGCCWMFSAFPHPSQTTLFYRSYQLQLSQPLLVLSTSPGKWGQEALQMLPNSFRNPKVLLQLPLTNKLRRLV